MNAPGSLVIRADADAAIGVGHVMRCLALAQAWQDRGGECTLVSAELPTRLADRLAREGVLLASLAVEIGGEADADETAAVAATLDAAWVVVDGYRFNAAYCERLRAQGCRVLFLDDMVHLARYPVDVLLNQNLSARAENYVERTEPDTALLLGPRFSLLRREFRAPEHRRPRSPGPVRHVLVTFGGGDAPNFTGRILRNLIAGGARDWAVVVLAGAANPHVAALQAQAASAPFACEVRVDAPDVAAVMAWADVAITAAGSTVWELAALGLPALVGACEDNQLAGFAALQDLPLLRVWTVEELLARDLSTELLALGRRPVAIPAGYDAQGAVRVVDALLARPAPAPVAALSA